MRDDDRSVAELGEDAVISAIRRVIDPHNADRTGLLLGPGDDAALLAAASGQTFLTTDTLSEGQDFRRQWWSERPSADWPTDVGIKSAAQNLSDLNAMAATPLALLVSLTLPPTFTADWVESFYRGIVQACSRPGAEQCVIAGGDLGSGPELSVTVTAVGEPIAPGQILTRNTARPGDVLAVRGRLGYAAAGLALLEQEQGRILTPVSSSAGDADDQECVAAQIRPDPPLTAGIAALRAGATSGMDLSDGLLRDCGRLARASGVHITLDDTALLHEARHLEPVALRAGLDPRSSHDWVLTGGEDYALLVTFPPEVALPKGFRSVGEIRSGPSGVDTGLRGSHQGWDSLQ